MKKFIISVVFLILCALTVFFIGWVQFSVPAGKYGILISKTGGLFPHVIESGVFAWRWERLLPTNTELRIFDLSPKTITQTVSGSLPLAAEYTETLASQPDFSYMFTFELTVRVKKQELASLMRAKDFSSQQALDHWVQNQSRYIAELAAKELLRSEFDAAAEQLPYDIPDTELIRLHLNEKLSSIEITDLAITESSVPDAAQYNTAKLLFEQRAGAQAAQRTGRTSSSDSRTENTGTADAAQAANGGV